MKLLKIKLPHELRLAIFNARFPPLKNCLRGKLGREKYFDETAKFVRI
jgi:hypothetical protein